MIGYSQDLGVQNRFIVTYSDSGQQEIRKEEADVLKRGAN